MTEQLMFKRGFSIGVVALLQAIFPPVVAVTTLLVLCRLYDVKFDNFFMALSIIVATLTCVMPRGRINEKQQLLPAAAPLIFNVMVRWMVIVAILLAIGYVTKYSEDFSRRVVLTWVVVTPALLVVVALGMHELMRRIMHDPSAARRVAFAGCTDVSMALADRITANASSLGYSVRGFFDDRSEQRLGVSGRVRVLGTLPDLVTYAKRGLVDVIFVALPVRQVQRVKELMEELQDSTVSIYYVPDIFMFDLIQARTGEILGMPVVAICETPFYGYHGVVKRITDVGLASAILLIAAPLMLAIALLIRYSSYSSPGPILFKQRRYGMDGREIIVYKFRTMSVHEDGEQIVQAKREDARVTPLGRLLRRYSLDELPQLINVLQGRMSLVGPRPHAVAHNEEYRKLLKGYMIRHKAPPGITGLAQVSGCRGETARLEDMQARLNYDLEYLRRWTPLLDLKILYLTALRVMRDEKAY
jgi:putative colanic acid biosynthesis UDP-glucose lipid carrier transferase